MTGRRARPALRAALGLLCVALLMLVGPPAQADLLGGLNLQHGLRLLFTNDRGACTDPDKEGDVYLVSRGADLVDAGCWWRRGDSVLIDLRHQESIYVLPERAVDWLVPDLNKPKPVT